MSVSVKGVGAVSLAGIATGSVISPPNPATNPLVAAFVFCQRISELTCSSGLASLAW